MPRPPVLPVLDWKGIFAGGKTWDEWLLNPEFPDHAARMEKAKDELRVPREDYEFLRALPRPVHVVAIAEDWCGDVVRHAPVLEGLAYFAPDMQVRYIRRADHRDVFARFLTNGGEAIPKFVFLNDKFVECGNWGPMQEECRRLIARGKACGDLSAARRKVKELYDADPNCMAVQRELMDLIETATASAP